MAKKKPTTKTKKLHPGGSVDRATPVIGTAPAPKQQRRNVGQLKPVTATELVAPAPSPKRSAVAVKQPGALIPGPAQRVKKAPIRELTPAMIRRMRQQQRRNKRKIKQTVPGRLTPKQIKRATQPLPFAIPSMPTAGVSQGRPVRSRTPMPGPAPDSARMRRMQQLMRQQQARFNRSRKMASNDARRRPKRDSRDRFRTRRTGLR